jgi:putative transposase
VKTWPHAPSRAVQGPGTYILTAGTYLKQPLFKGEEKLELLQRTIFEVAESTGWQLEAWAVFANHYHLIASSRESEHTVYELAGKIHGRTAGPLNRLDNTPGRKVWYRSWATLLTIEKSYLARLAYVHRNAVHHGLVANPEEYPYCSARWFYQHVHGPFVESVMSFKTDRVNVIDDFGVLEESATEVESPHQMKSATEVAHSKGVGL